MYASVWKEINRGRNICKKYHHDFEYEFASRMKFLSIFREISFPGAKHMINVCFTICACDAYVNDRRTTNNCVEKKRISRYRGCCYVSFVLSAE